MARETREARLARLAQEEAQREQARREFKENVAPKRLLDLMRRATALGARNFEDRVDLCVGSDGELVVKFDLSEEGDRHASREELSVNSESWKFDSVESELFGLEEAKLAREEAERFRKAALEKARSLMSTEELKALGL